MRKTSGHGSLIHSPEHAFFHRTTYLGSIGLSGLGDTDTYFSYKSKIELILNGVKRNMGILVEKYSEVPRRSDVWRGQIWETRNIAFHDIMDEFKKLRVVISREPSLAEGEKGILFAMIDASINLDDKNSAMRSFSRMLVLFRSRESGTETLNKVFIAYSNNPIAATVTATGEKISKTASDVEDAYNKMTDELDKSVDTAIETLEFIKKAATITLGTVAVVGILFLAGNLFEFQFEKKI